MIRAEIEKRYEIEFLEIGAGADQVHYLVQIDWEAVLAIVIGKRGKYSPADQDDALRVLKILDAVYENAAAPAGSG